MTELICLFKDFARDLAPAEKRSALEKCGVDVLSQPARTPSIAQGDLETRGIGGRRYSRLPKEEYRNLVQQLGRLFSWNASSVFAALVRAGPGSDLTSPLSAAVRATISLVPEVVSQSHADLLSWAANPENWYLLSSDEPPFELQARISADFPCLVFENGPIECATTGDPVVRLENLDEIFQSVGIDLLWRAGALGDGAVAAILDTGVNSELTESDSITATSVDGLPDLDSDGHGSAMCTVIRAFSPRSRIFCLRVLKSHSDGTIWNLVSGLTQLYGQTNVNVCLAVGSPPSWLQGLGAQSLGFQEAISGLLASLAAAGNFPIAAAGNDGLPELRWPAASQHTLAVGSHNELYRRSSFSNFQRKPINLVLAPGGDIRRPHSTVHAFGHYGHGLTRDAYGTSLSAAVAVALSCLLQQFPWFEKMQIPSRISLFSNHSSKNEEGLPILNVPDIGAVWPIHPNYTDVH